jgi:single-stranded-DNA-specific exonuclease
MHQLVQRILEARGFTGDAAEAFITPDFVTGLHNPVLMKDMEKAVQRLHEAIVAGECITAFGDYDADGIPGTALFTSCIRELGGNVTPIIPRRSEGYGLTTKAVTRILETKPQLVVTIDNGSTAHDEVAMLQEHGVDVICIDHHEVVAAHAAKPFALVNPKQVDCTYPYRDLCAAGLVWKVLYQLYVLRGLDTATLRWQLDLVALSTIADMVPLTGENRVLAYWGLVVLRKSKNLGLRALAEQAGISLATLRAQDVGFMLAPRINAPGRLHDEDGPGGSHVSLELLLSQTKEEARALANRLGTSNGERQELVRTHRREAQAQIRPESSVQLVGSNTWSTGVIGLVASSVAEQTGSVAVALAPEGGVIKGSLRAPLGASCLDVLALLDPLLERGGGHVQAAGLTCKEGITLDVMLEQGAALVASYSFTPVAPADDAIEIRTSDVTVEFTEALSALEPFGVGFPMPLVSLQGVVRGFARMGAEGAHARWKFHDSSGSVSVVAFRLPEGIISEGMSCTLLGEVRESTFGGNHYAEILFKRVVSSS